MLGLSIRSLLMGLFALMALVVGGEGYLAINKIAAVNNSVVDISTNWMPSMDVVRRMNATAEQYRVYQARHLMAGTEEEVNRQEAIVNRTGDALTALFKQYDGMVSTADERKVYDALKQSGAHYMQLVPDFLKASRANKKDEAQKMYVGDMSTRFTAVRNDLNKLAEINDRGAKEATELAAANYTAARTTSIATLVVGLLIAAGAMAFSFFGIARPIGRITGAMDVLASGDTTSEIPFAARKDEAGRGFAVVASEVKQLASQTAKATDEISSQIAGMQDATQESVAAIKKIGNTINRISEITTTVAAAVDEQGSATHEISRNVGEAAKGTLQVATSIAEVTRGAGDTGTASARVFSSAKSLSRESTHLRDQVAKFLVTVRAA